MKALSDTPQRLDNFSTSFAPSNLTQSIITLPNIIGNFDLELAIPLAAHLARSTRLIR